MRLLSSAVIGGAADIAIDAFNASDLNILFFRAGLGNHAPGSAYGKSALANASITPAMRAAAQGDESAKDGLNEFVRLVAKRVAARDPGQEIEPGTPFWRLREAVRSDGFDLRAQYSSDRGQRFTGVRFPAAG